MAFDYKKEYKEFYLPPKKPGLIEVPAMNYVAVRGKGDPNDPEGEYKAAMNILYGIAFTIKMSYKGSHKIEGYFSYVVPPLEGFWTIDAGNGTDGGMINGVCSFDGVRKERFQWISMIRLPDFVDNEEFRWAVEEASAKKKNDFSKAEFLTCQEGTCVQCMHVGSYDREAETIQRMHRFAKEQGYVIDLSADRMHHEIYLSDPRRMAEEKLRTVIRLPVRPRK